MHSAARASMQARNWQFPLSMVLATLMSWGVMAAAEAQQRSVPGASYFVAAEELYRGDYRSAERQFQNEVRGGIRTVQARWVDSICYRTMLGETYYQAGNPAEALRQYNAACELFLSYPKWLLSVEFRQPPRPDSNPNRRLAPWGRPTRQVTYGTFPESMLVSQGEMITEQRLQRGGPLQSLQMWQVNVIEVVRTTALAIRRRNEILGPLAPHDAMSKRLVDVLARGGNAPRNHWSNAWTEVLRGLAHAGAGETEQALTHLNRGVLIDGRYDHPLTGVALLGQARLALASDNAQAALNLATEASYAAYAYEDMDVVGAALELGHQAFIASGSEGTYAPLTVAATWASRRNLDHLAASYLIAQAEELALAGHAKQAQGTLSGISARRRELATGRLAPQRRYVEALAAYTDGNRSQGDNYTAEAIAQQRGISLRNFQISLANQQVDGGQLSPRIAVDVYAKLVNAPSARDWVYEPLETLTNLSTLHEGALARWMIAALSRDEVLPAIEIADLTKRRRFWQSEPIGGRLLAIRHLLETDPNHLEPESAMQRRNLLLRVPDYTELATAAAELEREIAAEPLLDSDGRMTSEQQSRIRRLARNAEQREALIRRLVLRRDATDYLLPPPRAASEVQAELDPGQALVMFHQAGTSWFAFLLTREGYHHWRLPETQPLAEQTAEMLRTMGHFNRNRKLEASDLALETWQAVARQFGDMLFAESRLDLGATTELVIVPDGVLWHVPFEALQPSTGANEEMMIDRTPIRYAPTMSYAIGDRVPPRPIRTTLIAAASDGGSSDFLSQQMVSELKETVTEPRVVRGPVPVTSSLLAGLAEQLILLQETELAPGQWDRFSPLPLGRSNAQGTLVEWLELPLADCERLLLAGVRTAAETGLQGSGRRRNEVQQDAGHELFHTTCRLLASGGKTVLVSRWQTGGRTHRELVREFALELPYSAADQAWRRSVALARRTTLDPLQEPRLEMETDGAEFLEAEHPFLWSGYLLVDTGYDPTAGNEDDADGEDDDGGDGDE